MTNFWQRFTWDLNKIPKGESDPPSPYILRPALAEEEDIVQKVVSTAMSTDSGWGDVQKVLLERVRKHISQAFEKDEPGQCLALLHGSRIIGCSVISPDSAADNNLVTGPCILHEYRSRGLGSFLLSASLAALREAGLKTAYGVTRDKTIAARFIYPKFGGQASPWEQDTDVAPKLAA